jgi:hypothetical protein
MPFLLQLLFTICLLSSTTLPAASAATRALTSKQEQALIKSCENAIAAYKSHCNPAQAPDGSTRVIAQYKDCYIQGSVLFVILQDMHSSKEPLRYQYNLATDQISQG